MWPHEGNADVSNKADTSNNYQIAWGSCFEEFS